MDKLIISIHFKVSEKTHKALLKAAEKKDIPLSQLVREFIKKGMK